MPAMSATGEQPNAATKGLVIAIAVFLALVAFHGALWELVTRWTRQEEYSHGFMIPFVAAWLLWMRRDALAGSMGRPSWTGPVLVLLAIVMLIVGELGALFIAAQLGFLVALIGIVLSVGGYSLLKVVFIPIAFLGFAIPLPYFIDSDLSWRLQLISSQLGVAFIRLFQIPVYLEGNVIDLGNYKLQVVEACSGLRYLYPFLSLGFLAAYLFHAPMWQRAIVFLSTIPITIAMNSFRIGLIGLMVNRWGTQSADGFLHFFEGWVIFIACAALLAVEIALLARLGSRKSFFEVFYPPRIEPSLPVGATTPSARRVPAMACLSVLCIAGLAAMLVDRQEIVPERTAFSKFPGNFGEWRGWSSSLDPQTEHFLGLTDYILSDYRRASDHRHVNFYVAYYASQRKGFAPHSPSVCIPGNGWQITSFERASYDSSDRAIALRFNRAVIQKNSSKQIVYYWFEGRGKTIENEWWAKWYLLRDALLMNRTDGALVRLTTPVYPNESEADADRRLQAFIQALVPTMAGYLPREKNPDPRPAQVKTQSDHS